MGVVKEISDSVNITLKSGEVKEKRVVTIFDDSMASVEVIIWGEQAREPFVKDNLLLVKDAKVNEFNG